MPDLNAVKDLASYIQDTANKLWRDINDDGTPRVSQADVDQKLALLRARFEDLGRLMAWSGGPIQPAAAGGSNPVREELAEEPITLTKFMGDIADGMIAAQGDLDKASNQYIAGVRATGGTALPSLFRVPKISGEFQFAVSTKQEKGFNIIVASKSDTTQKSMQQKMSFEIVAVPPPPELLNTSAERELVRLALNASADALAKELGSRFDSALFLRGKASWLVLWARDAQNFLAGEVPFAAPTSLVVRVVPAAAGDSSLLAQWLHALTTA